MELLIEKYNIKPTFFKRYFMQNAENRLARNQLEFMLWKRGNFIRPQDKIKLLTQFLADEIETYYTIGKINIPQLQFAVTTRCSLKCKQCNALIPDFNLNGGRHINMSFEDFKQDIDLLRQNVNEIRRFMILGGEPLLNKELPDMIAYCAQCGAIKVIEIITNGTILPSASLLRIAKKHADKIYFHLSNYSTNEALAKHLKYAEIINVLKENGIKHQMSMNLVWNREETLKLRGYSDAELKGMFDNCWLKRCMQVFNGKIYLCPRLASGYELGVVKPVEGEYIDLRNGAKTLKQDIINFYEKDYFNACRYCVRIDEQVEPAIQE
jgi:organic radical activating enzyme